MAAAGDVGVLQDEVERILRRLSLEETKEIAVHLQLDDAADLEAKRDVMRLIQEAFDAAADDDARNTLLRGLPIPETQRVNYERLLAPEQVDTHQNVDQIVPQHVGFMNNADDGVQTQDNLQQHAYQNAGGFHPLHGMRNPGAFPVLHQNAVNHAGALYAGIANAGGLYAGAANVGGLHAGATNAGALYAGGGLNAGAANAGGALNVGGANAGGFNMGVVAQNRLLYAQNAVAGGAAAAAAVNARPGGLMQNPRHVAIQNALNAGNQGQNAGAGVAAAQNVLNTGLRPRVPQNAGIRPPAANVAGAQNALNGGQPANLAGIPQFAGPNMQLPFPQYPQQRFVQMFPREFRMTGTICDDITKSMTYLDICRQVSDGRLKGYSDPEILSGMRRIMTTGAVKTIVDSHINKPLEEILLFLRSFLKTETPSELNNRLSQLVQQEGQLAIKFFMDAMEIRQLIVIGSQVEGTHSYDPNLVHSTFLHTIRTGLRDESVRSHMLPFLTESSQVDDNVLIRELHKAVAESEERRKKTEKPLEKKPSLKVNAVESSPELAALIKLVQDNQNQMKVMQEQMGELLKSNPAVRKFKKPGCEACAAANKADSCRHCWKCGDDGHKASETDKCPKSN